jgi:hypothetical protein
MGISRSAGTMAGICSVYDVDFQDCFNGKTDGSFRRPNRGIMQEIERLAKADGTED